MSFLKRHFISGLIVIIPISLSLWILFRTVMFFENILGYFFKKHLTGFYTPGLGFISLIVIIFLVGFVADNYVGKKLLRIFEVFFEKAPYLKNIYSFIKGILKTAMLNKSTTFRAPVRVKVFNDAYTIGFITKSSSKNTPEGYVTVFVPTVPNISTGFYLIIPEKDLERLNISVEDALKTAISMGIYEPENGSD